jgi:hypothetical protein
LEESLLLGQRRGGEPTADATTELGKIGEHRVGMDLMLVQALVLLALLVQDVAPLRDQLTALP